ncbi:unnamed protein product [Ostreobium quekettii]|uniref:Uncharacterized protein n=1 Tax=Ostreobium quekettii TaxID=121088 RepID=A0A8S1JB91_9CHLO|nr:unnamed protein product [Ostreobium quekettii]
MGMGVQILIPNLYPGLAHACMKDSCGGCDNICHRYGLSVDINEFRKVGSDSGSCGDLASGVYTGCLMRKKTTVRLAIQFQAMRIAAGVNDVNNGIQASLWKSAIRCAQSALVPQCMC